MTFVLYRYEDVSKVSGTGVVCEGAEFSDGAVAVRWLGDHPSTSAWNDIRDMEAIHGHHGRTVVRYSDDTRLVRAYQRVMPFIVSDGARMLPVMAAPHPDHPGRLRLVFADNDEKSWRWWVAALDGSTYAAVHEEVNGEMQHRWVSPDGDLWLQYTSPLADDNEPTVSLWELHDDPEMNR